MVPVLLSFLVSVLTILDLPLLPDVLQDNVPAYILAKVSPSDWLAISYVPESAKVRDKMLYASTRASLLKALGSTLFTDSLFATSKADLTPEAYVAHRRHINAPKPLSAREQEIADVRAAESGGVYEGSRARVNHIGTGVGFQWSEDLQDAVRHLAQGEQSAIVIIEIERQTETLILKSSLEANIEALPTLLPSSQPCYALFAWPHEYSIPPRREIVYIYSCPSTSPIKDRMIYSSGVSTTYQAVKTLLAEAPSTTRLASRKIETSDPSELDEAYLKAELGFDVIGPVDGQSAGTGFRDAEEKKPFARPRGPARKRRQELDSGTQTGLKSPAKKCFTIYSLRGACFYNLTTYTADMLKSWCRPRR
ncbi:Twinfilin [Termitomyces sp. T112]|nr:Twinfilin [Termitomyces sp. T112]